MSRLVDIGDFKSTICRTKFRTKFKKHIPNKKSPSSEAPLPPISVPQTIQEYLDVWRVMGLRVPATNTKTFHLSIQMLKKARMGKLFNEKIGYEKYADTPVTLDDWRIAVTNLYQATYNPDVYPINKKFLKKLSIADFLFAPYIFNSNKSLFLQYLSEPPKPVRKTLYTPPAPLQTATDDNSIITSLLSEKFAIEISKDVNHKFNTHEMNCFIKSASMIVEILNRLESKIKMYNYIARLPYQKVNILWESVMRTAKEQDVVTAGWFCNELAFDRRVTGYLRDMGWLK